MKLIRKLAAKARAILTKPRVMHYLDIFVAGTATALYYNRYDLLGAHGLHVLGSLAFGACVCGAKAVIEAYRKSTSAEPTTSDPIITFRDPPAK
jgi:hypothetical protein